MAHGGIGLGHISSGLRSLAPRASLAEGLVVRGSVVREVRKNVEAWVSRLTILKN